MNKKEKEDFFEHDNLNMKKKRKQNKMASFQQEKQEQGKQQF